MRQREFVLAMRPGRNPKMIAAEAARQAGFSVSNARRIATRFLHSPEYAHVQAACRADIELRFAAVPWQSRREYWLNIAQNFRSQGSSEDGLVWILEKVDETSQALNTNLDAQERVLGLPAGAFGRYGRSEWEMTPECYWEWRRSCNQADTVAILRRMMG